MINVAKNIEEYADSLGVKIVYSRDYRDNSKQGIHLLNPTDAELENAIIEAKRKHHQTIFVHTIFTWPKVQKEWY